jgi:toxin FitB
MIAHFQMALLSLIAGELDEEVAQIWGRLRVPNPETPLGKQITATALIGDLTVVRRNTAHFVPMGVQVLNPFFQG